MERLPARFPAFGAVAAFAAILSACSTDGEANDLVVEAPSAETVQSEPWRLPTESGDLYSASCPSDQEFIAPETIVLNSTSVPSDDGSVFAELPGVSLENIEFVAGYHLTSDDPRFGGVSGLAASQWGSLVAVTDQGDFVWITLDQEHAVAPISAAMATMRDASGSPLANGKKEQDAEGLAIRDGLAIVSFERRHRVAAFDLKTCGATARAAPVMELSDAGKVPHVKDNGGVEALGLTPEGGLILGLETPDDDAAPLSIAPPVGLAEFSVRLAQPEDHRMTGVDFLKTDAETGIVFSLHRAYSPLKGARIALQATEAVRHENGWALGASATLVKLALPGPTDNFEGVSAIAKPEGGIRLYIVSDDNFSDAQRTLLYVFDLES